jgi:hypothetical protein
VAETGAKTVTTVTDGINDVRDNIEEKMGELKDLDPSKMVQDKIPAVPENLNPTEMIKGKMAETQDIAKRTQSSMEDFTNTDNFRVPKTSLKRGGLIGKVE